MTPLNILWYFIFSFFIYVYYIFIYLSYYSDSITSTYYTEIHSEYDYIIIGAGTAGSLIAHRIATETNFTYIVLEAGRHSNAILDIPVLGPLLFGSAYDWQFETTPQENACFAMKNKKCRLPQGKIVGGSSRINNMIHLRGNLSHYENWFHGKYTVKDIEKQFELIEREFVYLNEIKYQSKLSEAILQASLELGYENVDINSKFAKGFMKSTVSQKFGKRWSTSDTIRYSQQLVTNAVVEKIAIDINSVASGVFFHRNGKKHYVSAKKAVIISAGTFNTPKILQLSGIGPKELLKSFDIPLVKDLPVGYNLQDHISTGMDLISFNQSLEIGAKDMLNPYFVLQYIFGGTGPLTSPGCEVVGFLSTDNSSVPDIQFMVLPVGITSDLGSHLRSSLDITDKVWNQYFAQLLDKHTGTILPILLHPKSKGTVFINSKNPFILPAVDPKYLSEKDDIITIVKGLRYVIDFVESKAMRKLGANINRIHFPGCNVYVIFSDDYWECYVRHLTLTSYHPVGTCSMGIQESKTSVVDTSFRVLGVKSLYIADGSVLPSLPSGNINAAIAMMANLFFEENIALKNFRNNLECKRKYCFFEYINRICYKVI